MRDRFTFAPNELALRVARFEPSGNIIFECILPRKGGSLPRQRTRLYSRLTRHESGSEQRLTKRGKAAIEDIGGWRSGAALISVLLCN